MRLHSTSDRITRTHNLLHVPHNPSFTDYVIQDIITILNFSVPNVNYCRVLHYSELHIFSPVLHNKRFYRARYTRQQIG